MLSSFAMPQLLDAASPVSIVLGALLAALTYTLVASPPRDAHKRFAARQGLAHVKLPRRLANSSALLGDLVELSQNAQRFHEWVLERTQQFGGEPWQHSLPTVPAMIMLASPALVEDVTKTQNDVFGKGPYLRDVFHDLVGDAFFALDGDAWALQRQAASRFFTARVFRDRVTSVINTHLTTVCAVLDKCGGSEVVDLTELLQAFTLEAIAEMGFGLELDSIGARDAHPFQIALDDAFPHIMRRVQTPTWLWKLQRLLNVGEERKFRTTTQYLRAVASEMVAKSLSYQNASNQSNQLRNGVQHKCATLIEVFAQTMEQRSGTACTPELLRDVAIMFVIAGRDTTADTLNWLLFLVHKHPHARDAIRTELMDKIPGFLEGSRQCLTMEQAQQLTYLEAVIKETLRLYPVAPVSTRQAERDAVLVDGTFIARGSSIGISSFAMGRMASLWGDDVDEFKPERFLDAATGKLRTISSFHFTSFHSGPRICIGMNLAMLEIKLVAATLLARFNFDVLPNGGAFRFTTGLVLRDPLLVRVQSASTPTARAS